MPSPPAGAMSTRKRIGLGVLIALLAAVAERVMVGAWDGAVTIVVVGARSAADIMPLVYGVLWLAGFGLLAIVLLRETQAKGVSGERRVPIMDVDPSRVVVQRDDHGVDRELLAYLDKHEVKRARMIQYSGSFTAHVVRQLLATHATVELLLQDPEVLDTTTESGRFQRGKIESFLSWAQIDMRGLTVRLYREPPSLRGVKLDDAFVSVGWYTYRKGPSPAHAHQTVTWLYGHSNATVSAETSGTDGRKLAEMFDQQFEAMWRDARPAGAVAVGVR